jgi:hypothetical protein
MSKIEKQIFTLAQEMGDPYGFGSDTADYIACELQISTDEVVEVFDKYTRAAWKTVEV